jgi:uncharacterized membrane protein HdeD (DUF308 family)
MSGMLRGSWQRPTPRLGGLGLEGFDSRKAPPVSSTSARQASAMHWSLPAARALPALLIAVLITFSPDHSARFGLTALGVFALADAGLIALLVRRTVADAPLRRMLFLRAGLTGLVGVAALVLVGSHAATLLLLLTAWAVAMAILDLCAGVTRGRFVNGAKDLIFTGAAAAVLAVVTVALPADLNDSVRGTEGADVLTTSIIAVGVFGAWAAVTGLFLAIGGLSLKPAPLGGRRSTGGAPEHG